ncbi:MAG: Ig-like domain-containing protein, partial [Muribaculaceae bacterium]
MKKYYLLIAAMLNTITALAQFSGSGTGTVDDPYLIYNENQLAQLGNFLNQSNVYFKLQKDLDLTSWIAENNPSQGWSPVGVESQPFKGIFDGNNHKLSGIFISRSSDNNTGFFGYLSGATISNLILEVSTVKGNYNVGALAGYAENSTISSCKIIITDYLGIYGYGKTGGIVGYCNATNISNIDCTGNINWGNSTGGAAGAVSGTVNISNVTFHGNVKGLSNVGGSVGEIISGSVTFNKIYTKGNVTGSANVGGAVGELISGSSVTFNQVYSDGKITNSGDYTGGIVAKSAGGCIKSMESCSHHGDISGNDYVGGIIGCIPNGENQTRPQYTGRISDIVKWGPSYGTLDSNSRSINTLISNCCAIGNITANSYCGGLIGNDGAGNSYTFVRADGSDSSGKLGGKSYGYTYLYRDGVKVSSDSWYYYYPVDKLTSHTTNIEDSYYSGNIQGADYVGGLVGHKTAGELTKCYSYSTVMGSSNVGGIIGCAKNASVSELKNLVLKSNVAINSVVSGTEAVGRIYGACGDGVDVGAVGSSEGNRALTRTSVMLCGVAQDVIDDLQNGSSVGPSMLRLKANYVSWGWSFDENWNILETECYPYKKFQAAPPVITSNLVSQETTISGNSMDGGTVYLFYKDRDAVSTECDGNQWTFNTEALQSGAQVQLYAEAENLAPSYLTSTTVKYPGSGTEADPYLIYTASDLQGASNSGYFKLMNDIDLTSWIEENSPTKGWPAIGRNSTVATYINGDGHKVTGLWINTDESYNGLFSNYSAGYIKNLNVEVAAGKSVKGADYTGVLIGRIYNGKIINCSVKGDVTGTVHTGGVTGFADNAEIASVSFDGNVNSSADNAFVGGVVGAANETVVTSALADVKISATGATNSVGGVVGKAVAGTIDKSRANAEITAPGANNNTGGFAGYSSAAVSQCFSLGNVVSTGENANTGGLIGYSANTVTDCYSMVTTEGSYYTAGLVAYSESSIDKCIATGNVKGVNYGAGLVGELDGTSASVTNSVAANNLLELTAQSSWGCRVIGGFKNGCAEPELGSNLALNTMQVSLNGVAQKKTDDNIEGVATAAADLMKADTYSGFGWNMEKTWCIDEENTYPSLLWEVNVNPVVEITLSSSTLILSVGHEKQLTASVLPLSATNKKLAWTSSNKAVATVDADGKITAVAIGNAVITASATDGSNVSAQCAVEVVANQDEAIAALNTLVANAETLYNNSTEGENIGQYAAGARAELLASIRSVKSKINDAMSADDITACTNEINAAIALFESKKVTAGEDTDVTLYENIIFVENAEAAAGNTVTLSVKMNNTIVPVGFQCDFYAPSGTSVPKDEDDYYLIDLSTERTTASRTNIFETGLQKDGAIRILAASTRNYPFTGNDGEVLTITLAIDADLEDGEYPLIMKNVILSDAQSKTYSVDYVKSTLTVVSFTPGDVNGDGAVNIGDVTSVVNNIMGVEQEVFIQKAADVTGDGVVNIGDLTGIVSMIVGGNVATAAAVLNEPTIKPMATDISGYENVIYGKDVTFDENGKATMSICMKNSIETPGFQFDIMVPEGIEI